MARRKKNKKAKKGLLQNLLSFKKNERGRKITGLLFVLISLYLFIASVSYFDSWQADQDKVLQFSWSSFMDAELKVDNWLGRMGAFTSHQLIYWGFGIPSLLFLYLTIKAGFKFLLGSTWKGFGRTIFFTLLVVVFLSVVFSFAFQQSSFPWGGSFGDAMTFWLSNFIGPIGLFLLLLFIAGGYFVWLFNPSFENWDAQSLRSMIQWGVPKQDVDDLPQQSETDNLSEEPSPTLRTDTHEEKVSVLRPDEDLPEEEDSPASQSTINLSNDSVEELQDEDTSSDMEQMEVEINSGPIEQPRLQAQEENRDDSDQPYDPTADLSHYTYPSIELLEQHDDINISIDKEELEENKKQIIKTLFNYKIEITKIRATIGPTVTLYEIVPAPGVRISKIKNLEDDIALSLAALGIRIIAPIPGRGTIGIEVPNKNKQIVSLKEVLQHKKYSQAKMELPIALGKDISNEVFVADLAKMPHLLIAGATGQGKSVGINTILMSLLYKKHPSQVKLVLVDPKKVELFPYAKLERHFLASLPDNDEPIITDTTKVVNTLASLCIEMDQRYELLKKAHARNLKEYNKKFTARKLNPEKGHKYLPYIVLVIDEFADLIMTAGKEIELPIGRLAQLARAVGIHLIIATQRPSVNIITGIIKANFPARIAFKVTSKVDSRTILDASGADQLIGRGDMLFSSDSNLVRLQCAFVDTPEVEDVLSHIDQQQGYSMPYQLPEYESEDSSAPGAVSADDLDDMFDDAARLIVQSDHGSTSMIQRKLKLGYNRAGRIMDQLEHFGVVGQNLGSKPREVLIHSMDELETLLDTLRSKQTPY
jgi:S-DNA-T family DNA segregation ATPase FtsK/SpoIIIE